MKKYFTLWLLMILTMVQAQKFDFVSKWNEIKDLYEKNNDVKSTLPKLYEIKTHAEKENNTYFYLKSLQYINQIEMLTLELEDDQEEFYHYMEKMIAEEKKASGVRKAWLEYFNILAFEDYIRSRVFEFDNLTLNESTPDNPAHWTLDDYKKEIQKRYQDINLNKSLLLKEKIGPWSLLFNRIYNEELTPTLYHFFNVNYIQFLSSQTYYFKYTDEEITKNASLKEQIIKEVNQVNENHNWYDSYAYFLTLKNNRDEKKDNAKAEIYQEILNDALVQKSNYKDNIAFNLAQNFFNSGKEIEAVNLCNNTLLQAKDDSPWKKNCSNFLLNKNKPNGNIRVPKVYYPQKEIPIGVEHYQFQQLFYRIYNISSTATKEFNEKDSLDTQLNLQYNAPIVKKGRVPISPFSDYKNHSTIYKLEGLPHGEYKIFISNTPDFQIKDTLNDFILKESILISRYNFAYRINSYKEKVNGTEIYSYIAQLLEAETGKPLANTDIQLMDAYDYTRLKSLRTDENGEFAFQYNDNKDDLDLDELLILIPSENELISLDYFENIFNHYYYEEEEVKNWSSKADVFLDRSIYRPGQILYFKSILYKTLKESASLLTHKKVEVSLIDNNGSPLETQSLTSNEFGSISGEFTLPNNGLLGNYNIQVAWGDNVFNKYFNLEEYKRPKFEIRFDKIQENLSLSDSIQVKGTAVSFAGSPITDAVVQYRVTRKENFPFPIFKGGRCFPPPYFFGGEEEVINGTLSTNDKGLFTVSFFPDSSPSKSFPENYPITYSYTIYADVTDINGETQSQETSLVVGTLPKKLEISAPDFSLSKNLKSVEVISKNLNGQPVAAMGKFSIIKLIDPVQNIKLVTADLSANYSLLSEEELEKTFPHIQFKPVNIEDFALGETLVSQSFSNPEWTEENLKDWGKISIPTLEMGYYLFQVEELYGKDTIRAFKYLKIGDDKTGLVHHHNALAYQLQKPEYKVGETAKIELFTNLPEITVFYFTETEKGTTPIQSLTIKKGSATLSVAITPEMQNGVYLKYHFQKYGGFENQIIRIPIYKEVLPLKITLTTFRNKITPGEPEKWQLHISGKDKEKIHAELLATMYDASLDKIQPHQFSFTPNSYYFWEDWRKKYYSQSYQWLGGSVLYNYNLYPNYKNASISQTIRLYSPYFVYYREKINFGVAVVYDESDGLESDKQLEEVVVVGYGTKSKAELTGSVGSVSGYNMKIRGAASMSGNSTPLIIVDGLPITQEEYKKLNPDSILNMSVLNDSSATAIYGSRASNGVIIINTTNAPPPTFFEDVKIRKNLQETAFFYPQLHTDAKGDIVIEFTSPEALTQWKLMLLAHTQDLRTAYLESFTQTQKELMVIPNPPRFLREGDVITFSTKISNLSVKDLSGDCTLQLFDALTMQAVDASFNLQQNIQSFHVEKGGNTSVSWTLNIPQNLQAVVYRVIAKTPEFSDGEENSLPILSNRMLITETLPIFIKEGESKTYEFSSLKTASSSTLQNHQLTLQLNTQPTWMAIFSLPYLMDFPYECSEQLFNRYYAQFMAQKILQDQPALQKVLDVYAENKISPSKLLQNESLKNIALEETPWLKDALSQEEQWKLLAEHFQTQKITKEREKTSNKIWERQSPSGGFSWFPKGKESEYISQYILAGLGKLLRVNPLGFSENEMKNITALIQFLDTRMRNELEEAKKAKSPFVPYAINYLYARSFWVDSFPLPQDINAALFELIAATQKNFNLNPLQEQAQLALILYRLGKEKEAEKILHFLEETAVKSELNGIYWKSNFGGYAWYEKPIETQALIVEAFSEISPEKTDEIEAMKVWLIGQKQNQHWATSKSTADAIYALLYMGKSWSNSSERVLITSQFKLPDNALSQSGYIESIIKANDITPNSSKVEITKESPGVAMGGLYWQYFENLENIKASESVLSVEKELFRKVNSEKGPKLEKISENAPIKVGDKVTVRLTLTSGKDVEFIHLKDMRAAGFEPGNILSSYYYQNGIGYYLNSRDAATHFFFDYIRKGIYVLEYEVVANNAGVFSAGISTIQSMYAPELSAHSIGTMITIKN